MIEIWHTPQVDKHHIWKGYVDSYDNHAFGILQENNQNSFDAYPSGTDPKRMKVVVKYNADERVLRHRDFDTTGMPHCGECEWGIRTDSECTNRECSWGCYHNMGYSSKSGEDLGSRGMGKALQLLSGTKTIVRTTLPDGRFEASLWARDTGDWQWRSAPESAESLSSPGTEITTFEVIDIVHDQLVKPKEIVSELQERWFRLLTRGAKIEYVLVKNGKQRRCIVKKPTLPPLDHSLGEGNATVRHDRIVVKFEGRRLGELQNLHLSLAARRFGEDDRRWGIAIVKNGKQTITRFTSFPEEIPEGLRKRLFGYCEAQCTAEEPFLKEAETAQHTGYQWSHPTYKAVRRELRRIVREFVQPFMRAGGERVTAREQEEAKQILAVFNQALADVPDFNFFGKEMITQRRKIETRPKGYIYLSRIDLETKSYPRGEGVPLVAVIKNPTDKEVLVRATFEHFDPTPIVVDLVEDSVIVPPGSPENPATGRISWDLWLDPSQAPGVHWVQISLQDVKREDFENDEGRPIRGRRSIYCEMKPRSIARKRSGGGDPAKGEGTGGGEGTFGLAAIQWFKKSESRDTLEAHVDMSQAVAFVNARGRRLEFARGHAKSKKAYWPVVGDVIAEKLLERKAEMDAGEKERWSAEEVNREVVELQAMRSRLVRRMVEILGG